MRKIYLTLCSALVLSLVACSGTLDQFSQLSEQQLGLPSTTGTDFDAAHAIGAGTDLYKAASLSDEEVVKLANGSVKAYDSSAGIAPADSPYTKRLERLTAPYKNEEGLSLDYKVILDTSVNACAFPNGSIRFNSGLLDQMKDDEVLAVLGHEIGHIVKGHSKEKLRLAYAASAARKGVAASGNTIAGAIASSELGGLAEEIVNAQFSQSEESEADAYGLEFLRRHKINQKAILSVMEKFAKLGGEHGMLSSHPNPLERREALAKMIGEDSGSQVASDSPTQMEAASTPVIAKTQDTADQKASTATMATEKHMVHPGWYVQIAADTELTTAKERASKLSAVDVSVEIQSAEVKGVNYYRVLIGPYAEKQTAKLNAQKLAGHPLAKGIPFYKLIK